MLLFLLIVALLFSGAFYPWHDPYWHSYGYYPSGIGVVLIIVLIVLLVRR